MKQPKEIELEETENFTEYHFQGKIYKVKREQPIKEDYNKVIESYAKQIKKSKQVCLNCNCKPMPKENWEESAKEFWQYMSNGYSGGKDGLRCSECDNKYSGDAGFGQLCPICNFKQIVSTLLKQQRKEAIEEAKKEINKWLNPHVKESFKPGKLEAWEEIKEWALKNGSINGDFKDLYSGDLIDFLNKQL